MSNQYTETVNPKKSGDTASSLGRISWVDHAKAIGILLVVYGHVARGLVNADIMEDSQLFRVVDSILYSFHMPLFFFLSGLFFLDSFRKRGTRRFLVNKFETVFYPYLVWSIIQGSIEASLATYTNSGDVTFAQVFRAPWEPRAQFWFLYALMLLFVVFSLLFSFVRDSAVPGLLLVTAGAYLYRHELPVIFHSQHIWMYSVYFVLGMLWTKFTSTLTNSSQLIIVVVLAISAPILQYLFHIYFEMRYTQTGLLALAVAVSSIFFVVMLSRILSEFRPKLLLAIGASSMVIYLMHILFGSGIRIVLQKIFGFDEVFLHLLAGMLAGVIGPMLFVKLFKNYGVEYLFRAPQIIRRQ